MCVCVLACVCVYVCVLLLATCELLLIPPPLVHSLLNVDQLADLLQTDCELQLEATLIDSVRVCRRGRYYGMDSPPIFKLFINFT